MSEQTSLKRVARILEDLLNSDYDRWAPLLRPDGSARQRMWKAEDGWYIAYTTERVDCGRWAGKFVTMLYRPEGKGARTGKADNWRRTYARAFTSRRTAKNRALDLYADHSPKFAAKGRWWRKDGTA